MKSRGTILDHAMGIALLAVWGMAPVAAHEPTEVEVAAYVQSFEGYCQSIEDVLDTGAHAVVHDAPTREGPVIKWGREQGIPGLEGEIPLSRRRQALELVYREIKRRYLPDATLAEDAPDAGVNVIVGEPRVVMWAPFTEMRWRTGVIRVLAMTCFPLTQSQPVAPVPRWPSIRLQRCNSQITFKTLQDPISP